MRYRLWQRVMPWKVPNDPCDRESYEINEDAHELVWEWGFWTLEEALAKAAFIKEQLKGCFGESMIYYQIYDSCLYAYYDGEGFNDQDARQRREDPLGISTRKEKE